MIEPVTEGSVMPSKSLCFLAALTMFALALAAQHRGAGLAAAGTLRTLEPTPPARAPTPPHTSGVHAGAKRPNLGPTRHTRGPRPAARLVIPLESTGARRRRTISCGRAAIRTAGPAMWWITSCRSPVVVPMRPATCSGNRPRKRRRSVASTLDWF